MHTELFWRSFALAVCLVAIAAAARWLLNPALDDRLPYVTFFVAVVIAAWYGGLSATVLTMLGGFFVAWYLFVPDRFSLQGASIADIVGFLMYFTVSGSFAVFGEVTRRAQREAANHTDLLRTTLESIGDGVITTDQLGHITRMNSVSELLTGVPVAEALLRPLDEVLCVVREDSDGPIPATHTPALDEPETIVRTTLALIARDGTERIIDASTAPIRGRQEETLGTVIVFRDISDDRKRHQENQRQTAAAQLLAEELATADRRKDEFLAMLGHELRNPLAPVRTVALLLRQKHGASTEIASATDMIERQIGQLARIVDDLLDVSRISQGKVELRRAPSRLRAIVELAVESCSVGIEERRQTLQVVLPPEDVHIHVDFARIAQVVDNLIHNANKFTPDGGRIELLSYLDGDHVVIRIRDNGIGIEALNLEAIFEMFVQVDVALDRTNGGAGLGLTFVKNLVELHGGSVSAASEGIGCGSEFTVRLPTTDRQAPPKLPANKRIAARRVLVVDDNIDAADAMNLLLTHNGIETRTAYDGLTALAAAHSFHPEVILLDIGLPKLDGYQVCKQLRDHVATRDTVIIALTGWGQAKDRRRSQDAGFNAHLVKPVSYNDVLHALSLVTPQTKK